MKILVLADDFDTARNVIESLEIKSLHCIDENQLLENTGVDKDAPGYLYWMTNRAKAKFQNYSFDKNLVMLMHMSHFAAVELIEHDFSILIYNGKMKRRLFYSTLYTTDFTIKSSNDIEKITAITDSLQNFN